MIYHHFSHGSKFRLLYVCSFGRKKTDLLVCVCYYMDLILNLKVWKNKQVPVSCIRFAEDIQGLACMCRIFYFVEAFHAVWFFSVVLFCFVYDFSFFTCYWSILISPLFSLPILWNIWLIFSTCYWLKYLSQSFVFSILWNIWSIVKAIGSMTVYSWVNAAQTCQFQSISQCLILCLFLAQWY